MERGEYNHRLIVSRVGQRGGLVKIDTNYIHDFTCELSDTCRQVICLNCRVYVVCGEITEHTQYVRISITEQWITSLIRTTLNTIRNYQIRVMQGETPEGLETESSPDTEE